MNEPLSYEIPHTAVDTNNEALIAAYRKAETSLERFYKEPFDEDDEDALASHERREVYLYSNKSIAEIALNTHLRTHMNDLHENAIHMNRVRDLIDHHNDRLL